MAKFVLDAALDAALDEVIDNADQVDETQGGGFTPTLYTLRRFP